MSSPEYEPPATIDLPIRGARYHVRLHGAGPPVLLLHGFTGSGATWQPHAAMLGDDHQLIAVDLLGHGRTDSPRDPARYTVEQAAPDLIAILDALGLEDVPLLGYSMGGRLALHLALAAPARIRALILESASPGIADPAARASRKRADEELAQAVEDEGIAAFVAGWEALPLFASQAALPLGVRQRLRAQRLDNNPIGLANSLRGMGAGIVPPLHCRLRELTMPTLLIAGALDEKYRQLALSMEQSVPVAEVAIVSGAGHAVHLEQPGVFDDVARRFLNVAAGEEP